MNGEKTEQWVDLHVHTNFSDGLLTPTQVVTQAKEQRLSAVGIVDHDTIDGIAEAVEAGNACGVEIVPGVELSSQHEGREIHIIAYYFDPNHPRFKEYLEKFRQERFKRAAKMIENLNHIGIRLTVEEVAERSRGRNIGRPHLAEVLMEKGYVETFQEAFQRYIGYGSKAYEEKFRIKPEEAIRLIADARGLSFLAHPGYMITEDMIHHLIKAGLDGIEIMHPHLSESRSRQLRQIASEQGLLMSGGSDCHGGREGFVAIGHQPVPYTLLENMRHALLIRWDVNWEQFWPE